MSNSNPSRDFTPKYSAEQKMQISEFLLAGNKTKDIAETLQIPESTVWNIRSKMLKKGEIEYIHPDKKQIQSSIPPERSMSATVPESISLHEHISKLQKENAALRQLVSLYTEGR